MILDSIQPRKELAGKVRETFVGIGAMAVLLLALNNARAATPGVSPVVVTPGDAVIEAQVDAALNSDPTYYFRHVDVTVEHGVVTLSGYVWSTPAIYRATAIASEVPGVTRVIDETELERDGLAPHA